MRPDGTVGARNYVAIIPAVVCVNEVVAAITDRTIMTRGICHHQGCCQLSPDLTRVTDSLIKLGRNPNVGAVLVVSLGCEGVDTERLVEEIAATGKPVERVNVQSIGGTAKAIEASTNLAQKLAIKISKQQRQEADLSSVTIGIKCGASDATSGLASNVLIGYLSDKIVEAGGTVVFGETTEFIGAEHVLAKRARTPEVAARIYEIVERMENRAKSMGVDMRRGQPTPGNIKGGLSTIEEKSLGAIAKSGTKPIEGVLDYTEVPTKPGLWIKDTPGREIEVLTAMSIAGAQVMLFSTGLGAPQGFPTAPVLKICGNPFTYERMSGDMDVNAGSIIVGEKSIETLGDETLAHLIRVMSGEVTKSEAIRYTTSMDIYTLGPVI